MHRFLWLLVGVLILLPVNSWAEKSHEADHTVLKALLTTSKEAFNTKNFDLLKPLITKERFTVVTIDGKKFESLDAFRTYWDDVLKENKTGLSRIEVNPKADGPTEFLSDTVSICHGISNDRYIFTNGDVKVMPERWTAVMVKEAGSWKLSRIIFSANILDNPVLSGTKEAMQNLVIGGVLAGLLIGALGMWLFRPKKAA